MKQLGLEVKGRKLSLKRGEKRVCLTRALSKLRAPRAAACCLLLGREPKEESGNYAAPVRRE